MNLPSESESFKDIFEAIHDGLPVLNVDDPDFASHVETARNLIEVFRTDGPNTYKCGGFEIELDKIATAMLDCSFDPRGNPYVVSAILKCGFVDKTSETERSAMFTLTFAWLTRFLFILKIGHFMKASAAPSDIIDSPAIEGTFSGAAELGDKYSDLRDKVLQRDGYECVITGIPDSHHPVKRSGFGMEAAHIIRRSTAVFPADHTKPEFKAAAGTFDILRNWTRMDTTTLEDLQNAIDHVSNMLMLELNMHSMFDNYKLCLRQTDGNTYKLDYFGDSNASNVIAALRGFGNHLPLDALITLKDFSNAQGGLGLEIPNPFFLGIHAAIAEVMHASGAGEFFDKLLCKYGRPEFENIDIRCWEDLELSVSISQLSIAAEV